jgi:hypothetical protein
VQQACLADSLATWLIRNEFIGSSIDDSGVLRFHTGKLITVLLRGEEKDPTLAWLKATVLALTIYELTCLYVVDEVKAT